MASTSRDPISPMPKPPSDLSKAITSPDSDPDSDNEVQTFYDAPAHFSPEDEATLVAESNATKSEANDLFSQKRYSEAISTYDRALASCPNYLDYEIAVLKSNISACHIQVEDWKAAVDSATEALDGLDRLAPLPKKKQKKKKKKEKKKTKRGQQNGGPKATGNISLNDQEESGSGSSRINDAVIQIPPSSSSSSSSSEDESTFLTHPDAHSADISRIRLKALLRRAKARRRQSTWASLAGAEEDYRLALTILTPPPKPKQAANHHHPQPSDLTTTTNTTTTILDALRSLPGEISRAKEKEMGEMMGKLKELGNGILKPFGLSTDNFKMVKDEKSGGYSMGFEQQGGGK